MTTRRHPSWRACFARRTPSPCSRAVAPRSGWRRRRSPPPEAPMRGRRRTGCVEACTARWGRTRRTARYKDRRRTWCVHTRRCGRWRTVYSPSTSWRSWCCCFRRPMTRKSSCAFFGTTWACRFPPNPTAAIVGYTFRDIEVGCSASCTRRVSTSSPSRTCSDGSGRRWRFDIGDSCGRIRSRSSCAS